MRLCAARDAIAMREASNVDGGVVRNSGAQGNESTGEPERGQARGSEAVVPDPLTPWPPAPPRRPFWRRHVWLLWAGGAVLVLLAAISVALAIVARHAEPYLRARIIEGLQDHFHTKVELDSFHVQVRGGQQARFGIWATGKGLRIWPPHRDGGDHPLETAVQSLPLIQLEEFSFHVPVRWYKDEPIKIPELKLKGLNVEVPPKSQRDRGTGLNSAMEKESKPANQRQGILSNVLVQQVVCDRAELVLETDKPDKLPLTYSIAKLKLTHLMVGQPMNFDAQLVNARPRGLIDTKGSFGPWVVDDPGLSPVSGKYEFQHADLSDFNGIAGILSSNGKYDGTLEAITVDGEAMVPDFRLTAFGTKLPLHTNFHARVDGTNGDTYLDSVDAQLGQSRFRTAGKVVRVKPPGVPAKPEPGKPKIETVAADATAPGHLIDLVVDVPQGRIEDFVRLVSKSGTPLMTGALWCKATLHIPPGHEPLHMRMKLDGSFRLEDGQFTSDKFQQRVQELSLRGQGHPDQVKKADPKDVSSEMQSDFHIANGVATLPNLQYGVPGALIELHGTYAIAGPMQFDGTARMDAPVSKIVGGWKGFLLKPADRFFKKDGAGTLVPIKVRGTREQPDFGIDLGRLKGTHPERPGEKP